MLRNVKQRFVSYLRDQAFERRLRLPVFPLTVVIRVAAEPPRLARVRKIDPSALPHWQPTSGPIPAWMRSSGRRPL